MSAPCEPLPPDIEAALDPGIRRLVVALRAHGFDTHDSGDGQHVDEKEALYGHGSINPFPHVSIVVPPERLIGETDRLAGILALHGIACVADGDGPAIEGAYLPAAGRAYICLMGITDDMLPPNGAHDPPDDSA